MKNKKKKNKMIQRTSLILMAIVGAIMMVLLLLLYFDMIDKELNEIEDNKKTAYISKNDIMNSEGLYVSNIKENLDEYFVKNNIENLTYKLENERFYLYISVNKKEDELSYNIDKIVDDVFNVNARIDLANVESIEYRTGNPKESTVIRINGKDLKEFFAMTDGVFYFLGHDIETISYMDNHFYYLSYNPKYELIRTQNSCSKDVKNQIKQYNKYDYYYKYGMINFLNDYYQKLSSRTFTVEEKCKELETIAE